MIDFKLKLIEADFTSDSPNIHWQHLEINKNARVKSKSCCKFTLSNPSQLTN